MSEPKVHLHIYLKGSGTPLVVDGLTQSEASRVRGELTREHLVLDESPWYGIPDGEGLLHVLTPEVAAVRVAPRAQNPWRGEAPMPPVAEDGQLPGQQVLPWGVVEQADGSYVADGSDPQIPAGTEVTREGEPVDNPYGHFS